MSTPDVLELLSVRFKGLMTIGQQGDAAAFKQMSQLKQEMCLKYGTKEEEF